jgi:hypothetical protein
VHNRILVAGSGFAGTSVHSPMVTNCASLQHAVRMSHYQSGGSHR